MHGLDPSLLVDSPLPRSSKTVLERYLAHVERVVPKIGMHLSVQSNFAPLSELYRDHLDAGFLLWPAHDPRWSDVGEHNGFWIRADDELGDVAATAVARVYDLSDTFGNELRSSRIHYRAPPETADEYGVELQAPRAEAWTGRLVYSGSVWVRPDHRRRGFTKVVPRMVRAIAAARWNPLRYWTVVTPENDRKGVTRAYGSWALEGHVRFGWRCWALPRVALLFSMSPEVLLADLERSLSGQATR